MEIQLLREQEIFPSKAVLKNALGKVYGALEAFEAKLTQDEFALTFAWHYYRDGKAWLCKVCHKKKTIFWLSVWNGRFKVSFFFLERHLEGIAALKLNKDSFKMEKKCGKMIPLVFHVSNKKPFSDLLKLISYKKIAK